MTAPRPSGGDAGLGERFISSLAHELRSPLTVVVGYAELLRRRGDEDFRKDACERILQAVERLSHGLDDLLTVFAIERDHLAFEVQPLDLEPAVRDAVRRFDEHSEGRSIRLRAPAAWPRVYADEEHLGRVLVDMLRIASRWTNDGGEVKIAVSADGPNVSIAVAAQGETLSPEQLATVFERPPTREPATRGTGLELYKTRRLVELQGGAISATSSPDAGSTVTITLPVADGAEPS